MSEVLRKGMVIECIASTPDKDVSGEILDIAGADISPILEGRAFFNVDHNNSFGNTVGKVTDAKKIMKAEDCETPNQMKFWKETQKPFIWARGELYDGAGHKEADAIASIYKFYMNKNEAPPIRTSVEGKTLERGTGGVLKRTLIKNIALTMVPCNRATKTEVVEIRKSHGLENNDLIKSEDAYIPSFIEIDDSPLEKINALASRAKQLISEVISLRKSEVKLELKSSALLERLKQMTASLKN